MQNQFTYFGVLAAALAGPLLLSFDRKVAFYTKWKYLFPAMILPAIFFFAWDNYFTRIGIWSFNPEYITGIKLAWLPLEEVLFFFVVPYCCIFIYECVRSYFPGLGYSVVADRLLQVLAVLLFILGVVFNDRAYTGWTFLLFPAFVLLYYLFKPSFRGFHALPFLIAYAIILLPFLLVNGILTAIPIVLYNDQENIGIRLYTIPVEDIFYGMLLFFLNILLYEKLKFAGYTSPAAASSRNQNK